MPANKLNNMLRVLQPSFASTLTTIFASLAIVTVISLPALYKKLGIDLYFVTVSKGEIQNDLYSQYEYINTTINSSVVAANISIFFFWAVIGLVGYFIVTSLLKLIKSFIDFVRIINYTSTDRKSVAEEVLIHLLIRCGATGLAIGFYKLFMTILLPVLLVLSAEVIDLPLYAAALYVVLSLVIVALSLHVIVVLARLLLVRTRLFFGNS